MKKLANKVAVVTGGNSGIGLAAAKLFASEGAKVAITGRHTITLEKAVAEIGNGALGLVSDTSSLKDIERLYEEVSKAFGKIDVLVVNAGISNGVALAAYTEELFDEIDRINFKGAFFTVQKALPYLNDGASIILTSSTVAEKAYPGGSAYAATKAAVRSLARSFSAELADRKIRVNVLSPGPVDTPIFSRGSASAEEVEAKKGRLASLTVAKRMGTSEEMAAGFLYLASDDSQFMIGGELLLDGGLRTL